MKVKCDKTYYIIDLMMYLTDLTLAKFAREIWQVGGG